MSLQLFSIQLFWFLVRMTFEGVYGLPSHPGSMTTNVFQLTSPTCEDLGIPRNITSLYLRESSSLSSPVHHDFSPRGVSMPHGLVRSLPGDRVENHRFQVVALYC